MKTGMTIFLIGNPGTLQNGLAEDLLFGGHRVTCLDASATAHDVNAQCLVAQSPLRIIFTPIELNEFALLENDLETGGDSLLATIDSSVKSFLAQIQAALQLLMRVDGGQLWVCDYDDSFSYHMDTPASPIIAQARAAAVRSLAKEYSRMNIAINTLFVQPLLDDATKPMFRQAAAALKSYALRYRPNTVADITGLLRPLLGNERLALSGAIIGTGTGVLQMHLTA